jgi:HAD superfamily hydrolase (TIGR01509 family)
MNKQKIEAVIFDCDGTLVDSEVLGCQVMWEVAVSHGCTLDEATTVKAFTGSNMAKSITLINAHSPSPMPEDFATKVRAAMAEKFKQELQEIVGASELLRELKLRNIPMAIATNGPRAKAELTLGLTGLLPYFQNPDTLFSAYQHDTFKPDPKLFLLAAEFLNVDPKNCAAVEDSWSGLKAAVDAGMQVFSLVDLQELHEQFDPAPIHLRQLSQLLHHL